MELYRKGAAKRLILSLAAGAALSGCVYAPLPYAYDGGYYPYAYPAYVGPPVSLSFGFYEHRYHGGHGWGGGRGWGGGGWSGRH